MKRMTLVLLLMCTVALAGLALAADEMQVTGTVVSSSGSTLVIRSDAGQEMTLFVDTSSANATGLSAGQRVTVNYDMDGGRNHVTKVDVTTGTTGTITNDNTNTGTTGTSTYNDNTNRTGTTGTSNYGGSSTTTGTSNYDNTRMTTGSADSDRTRNMPATASPLALLALGGVAALGSGAAIRGLLKR